MDLDNTLALAMRLSGQLDYVWTFFLFVTRFTAILSVLPGIGMGPGGLVVRMPAILLFSFASAAGSATLAHVPTNFGDLVLGISGEYVLGYVLGLLPMLIVTGVQMAATLGATSMGLQAANLIDPTTQTQTPDLARLFGDLVVLLFLFLGGQYVILYAGAGYGGLLPPGFIFNPTIILDLLANRTSEIFSMAIVISGPIISALMLTNLVLGLIAKAVPTVNVFIISFPLTIGIGLALSLLLIPELMPYVSKSFGTLEDSVGAIIEARVKSS